jgi:hypothetical protein
VKYLLELELTGPGFDFSALSEFRARLLAHEVGNRVLERLFEQFKARGWRHPSADDNARTRRPECHAPSIGEQFPDVPPQSCLGTLSVEPPGGGRVGIAGPDHRSQCHWISCVLRQERGKNGIAVA